MRSMLLSIMFCLISSVSWAEAVSWADLVENPGDGLVYKKFRDVPFTGVVMATADDPVQRSYKDGVRHGEWVEFDANGLVKTKGDYSEGKIQTIMGFENGKETTEEMFSYHENGQLAYKYNDKDGKQHGLQEGYYESGQLSFKVNFKEGEQHGLYESYYENGELKFTDNYKDGKQHGLTEFFTKDGSLLFSNKYENGMKVSD